MSCKFDTRFLAALAACWIGGAGLLSGCSGEPETATGSSTYFINGREVPAEFIPDAVWDTLDSYCELSAFLQTQVESVVMPANREPDDEVLDSTSESTIKMVSRLSIDQLEQIDVRTLPPELKAFMEVFMGPSLGDVLARAGLNSENLEIRRSYEISRGEELEVKTTSATSVYRLSAGTLSCSKTTTKSFRSQ